MAGVKAKIFVRKWVCPYRVWKMVKGRKQVVPCGHKNLLFLSVYADGSVRRSGSFCSHYELSGTKCELETALSILKSDCLERIMAEKRKTEKTIDFLIREKMARQRAEAWLD